MWEDNCESREDRLGEDVVEEDWEREDRVGKDWGVEDRTQGEWSSLQKNPFFQTMIKSPKFPPLN